MIEKCSTLYQFVVYNTSDQATAIYDNLTSLYYRNQVNHVGLCVATVPYDHPLVTDVALDTLIEVFISTPEVSSGTTGHCRWYSDFLGLYRDRQIASDENGELYYLLYFPSTIEILSRYINAYPAGVSRKTQWSGFSYSTIANDLVRWNCTAEATTANGRARTATQIRGADDTGAIVESGFPVSFATSNRPILPTLQELAAAGGFDFTVRRDFDAPITPTLEVRQFAGQLGTDRTSTLIFSLDLDNMTSASYGGDKVNEVTVAIVGGQGESASRDYAIVTGPNYAANNDYETFVDARDREVDELDSVGELRLYEGRARAQLTCEITSSQGYMYKRDFNLGDIATVMLDSVSVPRKIDVVEARFNQTQDVSFIFGLADTA